MTIKSNINVIKQEKVDINIEKSTDFIDRHKKYFFDNFYEKCYNQIILRE